MNNKERRARHVLHEADFRRFHIPVDSNSRFEHSRHERDHPYILDRIEEFLQIHVNYPKVAQISLAHDTEDHIECTSRRLKTELNIEKVGS